MELNEFLRLTLMQIVDGVKNAQELTRKPNVSGTHANIINPDIMYSADNAPKGKYFASIDRNLVHFFDFDVAVTTDTSREAKGNTGLQVAGIGIGAGIQEFNQNSTVSRIKFSVPIKLPKFE